MHFSADELVKCVVVFFFRITHTPPAVLLLKTNLMKLIKSQRNPKFPLGPNAHPFPGLRGNRRGEERNKKGILRMERTKRRKW